MKKIFIGASEISSERIAAKIVKHIPNDIKIFGVTGTEMRNAGVETIFDVSEISFIGLDAIPKVFAILRRINFIVNKILLEKPDVIIFVDGYDFYVKVAKKLKKKGFLSKIICVVPPAIWLFFSFRIKFIQKYFDEVVSIFAFESEFFKKIGYNKIHFFGNPFLENTESISENIVRDRNLIAITIGSRANEVKRNIIIIKGVIEILSERYKNIQFAILTIKDFHDEISENFKEIKNVKLTFNEKNKSEIFKKAYIAIAKSGTNTIEIANKRLPMIIYYKISLISLFIKNFILCFKYISLINIASNSEIVPEEILGRKDKIVEHFIKLYENNDLYKKQTEEQSSFIKNKILGQEGNKTDFGKSVADLILKC